MDYLLSVYKKAMSLDREIDCFNNVIVFNDPDSFLTQLTDFFILWRRCIIPIYNEGDHDIVHRVKGYVKRLLATDDVLSIYGAIDCMRCYDALDIFIDPPFEIDFSDCKKIARNAVLSNADKFKNYHGDEFKAFSGSPYELVARMVGLEPV